ncbi:MAG: tetratricopeptide repeat protein [Bacteroidaceae bacterium]|nr:tetratricopeptide repeat protein [Bacteroidaceae bacterium]
MKINKTMTTLLVLLLSGVAQAQQTATKLVADGHYFGARQQFERFIDNAEAGNKHVSEAEALTLVCDYVLKNPGTADNMKAWIDKNPASPYDAILNILRRNTLVREKRYDEAVEIFFQNEAEGIYVSTPLAYPLTKLSEEVTSYNSVLYRLAGEKLYDEGQYERAITYLENGEETRNSLYKLGMCYYKTNIFAKAYPALIQSVQGNRDELAQNALIHAGNAALYTNSKANAQSAFMNAAGMTANNALREQALYNYSLTLYEKYDKQTAPVMEQFLREYPKSQYATSIAQCLAAFYLVNKDYARALNAINKVNPPTADSQTEKQKILYCLANQELNSKRLQESIAYATQSINLGNKDANSYAESFFVRGDCNYRLGNYHQAASDLITAVNLGGGALANNTNALYTLGYAQFKQQKYQGAITNFQKAVDAKDITRMIKADSYNRMGDCHLNLRNYDEAIRFYDKAKATDHTMGDYSMLQQAYIQGIKGNYSEKINIINSMKEEYSNSSLAAKALYEQGRAYILSDQTDDAINIFNSIIQKHPGSEYAKKANEELETIKTNIAIQDSIRAAEDSIARAKLQKEIELAKAPVEAAQALYDAGQYTEAEKSIIEAIDSGINKPYWLARAFILLSDIYKAEDRTAESKQTLESLKENYTENDDIQTMIKERLK